jgi:hypothetical protein
MRCLSATVLRTLQVDGCMSAHLPQQEPFGITDVADALVVDSLDLVSDLEAPIFAAPPVMTTLLLSSDRTSPTARQPSGRA